MRQVLAAVVPIWLVLLVFWWAEVHDQHSILCGIGAGLAATVILLYFVWREVGAIRERYIRLTEAEDQALSRREMAAWEEAWLAGEKKKPTRWQEFRDWLGQAFGMVMAIAILGLAVWGAFALFDRIREWLAH
jgi:hypothetical protein